MHTEAHKRIYKKPKTTKDFPRQNKPILQLISKKKPFFSTYYEANIIYEKEKKGSGDNQQSHIEALAKHKL
jgi:hypothetical protein